MKYTSSSVLVKFLKSFASLEYIQSNELRQIICIFCYNTLLSSQNINIIMYNSFLCFLYKNKEYSVRDGIAMFIFMFIMHVFQDTLPNVRNSCAARRDAVMNLTAEQVCFNGDTVIDIKLVL